MESANGPASSQRNSADFGVLGFPSFRAYVNASFGRPTFPRGGEKKGEIPLSTRLPREIIECLSRRGGISFEFPFAGISFRLPSFYNSNRSLFRNRNDFAIS